MENPATWSPAERIVNDVLGRPAFRDGQPVIGLSQARQITDALRAAGLLNPAEPSSDELAIAVLHRMRDTFCIVKDQLRETGSIAHEDYERLVGEFFDGYQQAKRLLGLIQR